MKVWLTLSTAHQVASVCETETNYCHQTKVGFTSSWFQSGNLNQAGLPSAESPIFNPYVLFICIYGHLLTEQSASSLLLLALDLPGSEIIL